MRVLVVAATAAEVAPLAERIGAASGAGHRIARGMCAGHDVQVLTTGVGMVATATWCSRALVEQPYDLVLNAGLCGSFDVSLPPGVVVHTVADCLSELGAGDGDRFLSIDELGLVERDAGALHPAELVNLSPPSNPVLDALPRVRGITVNTVHGDERSIASVVQRRHPQVESMEGAAFMYAALVHGAPFAQVRAVSNMVERRNRAAWRIGDAVASLARVTLGILEAL